MLHNETINVWSHLIGVGCFLGILIWTIIFLSPFTNYLSISTDVAERENMVNQAELMLIKHSSMAQIQDFDEMCSAYFNESLKERTSALNEKDGFNLWAKSWTYELQM